MTTRGAAVEGSFAFVFRFAGQGTVAEFTGYENPGVRMEMDLIEFTFPDVEAEAEARADGGEHHKRPRSDPEAPRESTGL